MVLLEGRIVVFDGIEFNAALSFVDVISEIAFLLMDLDVCERPDLAWIFLNHYLEETGDYEGLPLLDLYRVYRSLVRAKVAYLEHRSGGARRRVLPATRGISRLRDAMRSRVLRVSSSLPTVSRAPARPRRARR